MSNIVKYAGLDLSVVDQVDERVQTIAGGDYEQIEVGENVYRILPALPGRQPIRVTAMHYVDQVPGLEKMVVFACPRVELKEPCPACARAEQLSRTGNPVDRERAQRLQPQLRVYVNVLNRKRPDAGPRVLSFGKQIWEQLKAIRRNPRTGGDYTNPTDQGFDIVILREGTGKNDTRYTVSVDRNNSPLADTPEAINAIIEATKDLDSFVNTQVSDQLLSAWGVSLRGGMDAGRAAAAALPPPPPAIGTFGASVMRPREVSAPAAPAPAPRSTAPAASAVRDAEFDDDFG